MINPATLFTRVRGIGILGSRTRSKSQQFVTDPRAKRSIRGGPEGKIVLATADRYRGAGQGGADCYSELRRIPLPRTRVNRLLSSHLGSEVNCCQTFCSFSLNTTSPRSPNI